MSNAICIDQNLFILGMIVLIAITFFYIKNPSSFCPICPTCPVCTITENDNISTTRTEFINPQPDPLIVRDMNAINNPLTAPTKRVPRHVYPVPPISSVINVQTRGYSDNYQYLGNLVRSSDEKIVKLFGRQTYPGSSRYEYYGITNDSAGSTKVKIESTNNVELQDGDEISIDIFDSSKGTFKLYINDDDTIRYNPFII
jgi:hypothetical protein